MCCYLSSPQLDSFATFAPTTNRTVHERLFSWATLPAIMLAIRNQNMIENENEKIDCIDALNFGLNRTAQWRQKMATRYPPDPRNARAADCLAKLAEHWHAP
jgi:hypothetical protein